jgi:hypothetical protein
VPVGGRKRLKLAELGGTVQCQKSLMNKGNRPLWLAVQVSLFRIRNQQVVGSNPTGGSNQIKVFF